MKPIIIENANYIELKLNAAERRFYFPQNASLEQKRIDRIISFSSYGNDSVYLGAPSGRLVVDETLSRSAYITLVNKAGKVICNKLKYLYASNLSTIPFLVNDVLDFKKCFIEFSSIPVDTDSLYLVLIEESQKQPEQLLNKYRVDIPVTPYTKKRYYFQLENFLKGKKIKGIAYASNSSSALLYLQTKDDRIINGVNLALFYEYPRTNTSKITEAIHLNDYEIQFNDSFIEVTTSQNVSLITLYFYY